MAGKGVRGHPCASVSFFHTTDFLARYFGSSDKRFRIFETEELRSLPVSISVPIASGHGKAVIHARLLILERENVAPDCAFSETVHGTVLRCDRRLGAGGRVLLFLIHKKSWNGNKRS